MELKYFTSIFFFVAIATALAFPSQEPEVQGAAIAADQPVAESQAVAAASGPNGEKLFPIPLPLPLPLPLPVPLPVPIPVGFLKPILLGLGLLPGIGAVEKPVVVIGPGQAALQQAAITATLAIQKPVIIIPPALDSSEEDSSEENVH